MVDFTVNVRGITIGSGIPKIAVPIVGKTENEILGQANYYAAFAPDIIEWRVDYLGNNPNIERILRLLDRVRTTINNIPLIFTIRSLEEGGYFQDNLDDYRKINLAVSKTKQTDIIDVELNKCDQKLVREIQENQVFVMASSHDFHNTPSKQEIISRLLKMQNMGADLLKIAVMPNNPEDVLVLLEATSSAKLYKINKPVVTMSMSGIGTITRLSGEIFGSSITFGSGEKSSAPGQISVSELKAALQTIHTAFQQEYDHDSHD